MKEKCCKAVVCVNNDGSTSKIHKTLYNITIGKVYQVTEMDTIFQAYREYDDNVYYKIIDDEGRNYFYNSKQFKDLSDIRDEKLGGLLS